MAEAYLWTRTPVNVLGIWGEEAPATDSPPPAGGPHPLETEETEWPTELLDLRSSELRKAKHTREGLPVGFFAGAPLQKAV